MGSGVLIMSNYVFDIDTPSFYAKSLKEDYKKHGNWPKNLIEISDEVYYFFNSGDNLGKKLCYDSETNSPIWREREEDLNTLKDSAVKRIDKLVNYYNNKLTLLSYIKEEDNLTEDEILLSKDIKKYLIDLSRVPKQKDFPTFIEWPTEPKL